jgi:hypothetical protein
MDKIKFTLGKFSFPVFFATNCTINPQPEKIIIESKIKPREPCGEYMIFFTTRTLKQ